MQFCHLLGTFLSLVIGLIYSHCYLLVVTDDLPRLAWVSR